MPNVFARCLIAGLAGLAVWTLDASAALSVTPAQISMTRDTGVGFYFQSARISSSSGIVNWSATGAMLNGTGWMTVTPPLGTASPQQSGAVTITLDFRNLPPGVYQGTI